MRRTAAVAAVVAVAAVGAVTGCSSDAAPASVTPDGWQRVEACPLTFAVPGDWVPVDESNDPWEVALGTDSELGPGSTVVTAAPDFGTQGAAQGLHTFVAGAQIAGWGYRSTGRSTPVDTDALTIERNDFGYDDAQGVFWAAADPGTGTTVALQLTAADLPDDLVSGIEQSIAVDSGCSA